MTPDADLDVARLTPSPPVTAPDAAEAIRACFGLSGELTRLPGEADDNFLLQAGDDQRYVVKFAHLRADPAVVDVQVRVLRHIESAAPGLPVPRVRARRRRGRRGPRSPDGPLRGRVVHALSYLDGRLLRSVTTGPAAAPRPRGHPGRARPGPARLRRPAGAPAAAVGSRPAAPAAPPARRTAPGSPHSLIEEQFGRLAPSLPPRLAAQRTQLVHNDFSPDNTLISPDGAAWAGSSTSAT